MKKQNNLPLGSLGENIASKYLAKLGWKIIARNFQKRYREIDIVALDKNTLVFVEVKTRKGNQFGPIEESITPWKIKSLKKSINYFLHIKSLGNKEIRVDLLGIELTGDNHLKKISHYKNIIY